MQYRFACGLDRNKHIDMVAQPVRPWLDYHPMDDEMPQADEIMDLPSIAIDQARPGDLAFFISEGPLQRLFWAVEDIWVHTALVVEIDGELRTAEVGTSPEAFSRPLATAVASYDLLAIGRTDRAEACLANATRWAIDQLGTSQEYAWNDFLLTALVGFTRKSLPGSALERLGPAMQEVARNQNRIDVGSRTCSGFVHEAFRQAGALCAIEVEMTDTNPLRLFGGGPRAEGLEGPEGLQDAQLDGETFYEQMAAQLAAEAAGVPLPEAIGSSRMTTGQFADAMGTAFQIVKGFVNRPPTTADDVPGRWTSPTDLWHCDELVYRARLQPPA